MLQRTEKPRTDFLYRKGSYLYFRFPERFKAKPVGLPPDQTSNEFKRAYDRCLATLQKMEADLEAAAPVVAPKSIRKSETGSIAKAIEIYLGSKTFAQRKGSSERIYRDLFDIIKREIGDCPLKDLDRDALEDFVDGIYQNGTASFRNPKLRVHKGSASMADLYVTVINNVWKEVRKDEQFGIRKLPNPTIEIERRHKDRSAQPHLKWNEEVQDIFVASAPDYLALAKEVLHFTAQRGGDAIRMKWTDYDGKGIKVWPEKTTAKGAVLDPKYHLLPRPLIALLDEAKETAVAETILVNQWGKPWTNANGLSQAIRRHMVATGLRKKGVKGPSMHGLRHTAGSDMAALPGASVKGVMSGTGHASAHQAMRYMEQADQGRINRQMMDAWSDELEAKEKARAAKRRAKRASLKVVK